MSYMVDAAPPADKILQTGIREWEPKEHRMNATMTRAAYRPYST
jgi:NADH:ubiquinone oxidoreductase subunit